MKQGRSRTSECYSPQSDQDKHTLKEPQDPTTMVAAMVRSSLNDLGVIKDFSPKESYSKETSLDSLGSSNEEGVSQRQQEDPQLEGNPLLDQLLLI